MDLHVCMLAAGQSKRMKSKISKLLHLLCGKPMVLHVEKTISELEPKTCGVVVGYQRDQVINALETKPVDFVVQEEQLGTGHAVNAFLNHYPQINGLLLILNGDTPLVKSSTLRVLASLHTQRKAEISLLTAEYPDPRGYGRIVRNADGFIQRIVEEADATEKEKTIHEINAGIYLCNIDTLRELLPLIKQENRQKEFYVTDMIELALSRKENVFPLKAPADEVMGINTKVELALSEKMMRHRINEDWMLRGVTMHNPEATYIDTEVQLGNDVVLYPNVYLEGSTLIGSEVTIFPNCRIVDSYIDGQCVIYENCSVDSAHLEKGVKVGPFARIRPGSYISTGARIGNFVELKKTFVGEDTKANHLSYLGDAKIGRDVNIGAGTITCNYDGEKKYETTIEDGVFIGSDTQLIAPVNVGKGAYVAAGSSITEDVPPDALAIARGRQVNKENWVKKKSKIKNKK